MPFVPLVPLLPFVPDVPLVPDVPVVPDVPLVPEVPNPAVAKAASIFSRAVWILSLVLIPVYIKLGPS